MASNKHINVESMLPTGSILHGNYRIDSYLSSGGFGNTYVATHMLFNETYAIKEFFMKDISERGSDSSSVRVSNAGKTEEFNGQLEKFRKEALRLRKLHNVHIVRVYDLFNENGTAYYVMDYINGENLKERLQRTGQPMEEKEVRNVLEQVLDALQEVHGQGIWHMDLKPANVMIDRAGVVKLIDFGASKQFNSDTGGAVSTSAVAYTNGYAPREQMERSYEKFGPWTDFYALGATLYNLLTLKHPPMPVDIDDDMSPDKHEALPMPSKVTPQMRGLVLWLIKTNRKQRPQNVQQIKEYLNPSLPKHTPPPVINFNLKTLTLNVSGMGTLHVYLDGREIQVPCTFPQQMQQQDYLVTATAQANGDVMSKEASLRVVIPALKQTALPEISYDPKTLTLNVTGNGNLRVLLNGKEIKVPYTFQKQRQEQSCQVTAVAQADGEVRSEEAILRVVIPALKQTALPEISYDPKTLTLNVLGQGEVHVLLNGKEIKVPYTFQKQRQEQSCQVTATAQADGEVRSEEAILRVIIPALKQTALPEISYDPKTLTLNVTGNGNLRVLLDGKEIKVPCTFQKQRQEQSYQVTATAQADGEILSEKASLKVVIPALKQTAKPAISYDPKTLTLNVTGNGDLRVLLDGKEIKVPCTFQQQRQEQSYQVKATAQADCEILSEEASLKVVIPALKQTAKPAINYDPKTLTLNVAGKGTLRVLLDGKEIKVPFTFQKQRHEQYCQVSATAQADGEVRSEEASLNVVIPALKQTALPEISYDPKTLTLNVTGKDNLRVLLDGKEIKVPYKFEQQEKKATYTVTATAQGEDELRSEEATFKVEVPAVVVLPPATDETKVEPAYDDETQVEPEPIIVADVETKLKPKPEPAPAVRVAEPVPNDEFESKSRKLWPVVLAACAGLLLVIGLYAIFHNSESPQSGDEASEEAVEQVEQVEAAEETKTVENAQVVIPLCADGTSCTYSGPVDADGMPDGAGKVMFDNGDRLEGSFKNGNAEGEDCKYYFKSGDKFEGTMQNNEFVRGRYSLPDGSYFDGTFEDYRPKYGTWYNKNGKVINKIEEPNK